jgi:hypothetical protein
VALKRNTRQIQTQSGWLAAATRKIELKQF